MSRDRFLFFTNECVGLGHLRRALALSRAVTEGDPDASALIVTGAPIELTHPLPPRVDTVKLPLLTRDEHGNQHPRRLGMALADVRAMRTSLALAAARSLAPAVAVVDKTPLGLGNELRPVLQSLRAAGARLVLGLRDIEDAPARVRRDWGRPEVRDAVDRLYDAILVYGPESSRDALDCIGWTDLEPPVHHVGYVSPPRAEPAPQADEPYLLVTTGGGADGVAVVAAILEAIRLEPLPITTLVVTGPLMPADDVLALRAAAAGLDVRIDQFRPELDLTIAQARAVVAMAGYNTVAELLRAGRPALLVPRTRPSREQLLRARSLHLTGRVEMLHPSALDAPRVRSALRRLLATREYEPEGDHDGAARAAAILRDLAGDTAPAVGALAGARR